MTYTDEYAARDERGLELERRLERDARFGSEEWRRQAVDLYPHLRDSDKHDREHQRLMLQNQIEATETELERLKEQMESLSE